MKLLTVFVLALAVFGVDSSTLKENEIMEKCLEETNLGMEEVLYSGLTIDTPLDSELGKFFVCYYKASGAINEDGTIDTETEAFKKFIHDAAYHPNYAATLVTKIENALVRECPNEKIQGETAEEIAIKLKNCMVHVDFLLFNENA